MKKRVASILLAGSFLLTNAACNGLSKNSNSSEKDVTFNNDYKYEDVLLPSPSISPDITTEKNEILKEETSINSEEEIIQKPVTTPNIIQEETPEVTEEIVMPTDNNDVTYIVKSGDSLYSICQKYYNDASTDTLNKLAAYNHLDNPNKLYINQTLLIPNANNLSNTNITINTETSIVENAYAGYIKYSANMYDLNGNFLRVSNDYQKCLIKGYKDNLILITDENGQDYYIEKNAVEALPGTYIAIDLSSQTLELYQNYELTYSTPVVTGKPSTPTYEGYFKVSYKTTNATLEGDGYSCPVSYWMPFNGGIGLHDATWRNAYDYTDASTYTYNGSHGCVNLPSVEAAKILYDAIYINNPNDYTIGENNTRVLVHD